MKKIAALVGAGALVLVLVVPAMAVWSSKDVTISNGAGVNTNVYTTANTGYNGISGKCVWDSRIRTGEAEAVSVVSTNVNMSTVGCKTCGGDVRISNGAGVNTNVYTTANTGYNGISGGWKGKISTGAAGALSSVYTLVNYSVVGE